MSSKLEELLPKDLTLSLNENHAVIRQAFGESVDLIQRQFVYHEPHHIRGLCLYMDGLANTTEIMELLRSLSLYSQSCLQEDGLLQAESIRDHLLVNAGVQLSTSWAFLIDGVLAGDTLILLEGMPIGLLISTRGWDKRSIGEPSAESAIKGPRDGFTENIRGNTAAVRRRVRDPQLRMEMMQIGSKTRTEVNLAYIEGTVREGLVEEVKARLQRIQIDGVLDSGYIEELIGDAPLSPFPTIFSTERPDRVAAALLEGRAAVFVDNSPFVIIVPVNFWMSLQASDDYYSRYWMGSFYRLIRFVALLISFLLPSLYIMLVSFHQEMIPTGLALTIASGREVVPFPVLFEAILMEFSFELMREAGLRMPKPIGQAVSIVGSLIIGQAAVQAGLVSPFMVIIVAITGISSFAIPNYGASFSIRLVRFPLLIASGTLGLLGFAAVFFTLMIHVLSLRSFGLSYMEPIVPLIGAEQKDTMIRAPWWTLLKRPRVAQGDLSRQPKGQKPGPKKGHGDKGGSSNG